MSIETLPRPMSTTPTPEVSRNFLTRVWQGPAEQERWARPALLGLLTATAFLYLWGLGSSGWANSFYSAAAQAGSASWKALFFGSSDAGNSITVDKPPMALWVMGLSVRAFGLSSWAILVPQALMGRGESCRCSPAPTCSSPSDGSQPSAGGYSARGRTRPRAADIGPTTERSRR